VKHLRPPVANPQSAGGYSEAVGRPMSERTSVGSTPKTPLAHFVPPLSGASRRAWTDAMAVRPFGDAYLVETADGTYVASGGGTVLL